MRGSRGQVRARELVRRGRPSRSKVNPLPAKARLVDARVGCSLDKGALLLCTDQLYRSTGPSKHVYGSMPQSRFGRRALIAWRRDARSLAHLGREAADAKSASRSKSVGSLPAADVHGDQADKAKKSSETDMTKQVSRA